MYEAERELALVLAALGRQSRPPNQLVICDDGSGPGTAALVARYTAAAPFEILHLHQEDDGFRKSKILNEGAYHATGNNLLFLDGDSVPHVHWVRDHLRHADGKTVWCGRRVKLGPVASLKLTKDGIQAGTLDGFPPSFLFPRHLRETRHLRFAIRLPPFLARCLHPASKRLMGCNFSLPKTLFEQVNGFDEAWEGSQHRCEDWDLETRLRKNGFPLRPIANAGVVFHLDHPERKPDEHYRRLREERRANAPFRSLCGLEEHGALIESSPPPA